MSTSGQYGTTRLCRAIVGHADLRLGDGVTRVLEAQIAAGDGRFRGIRHSVAWDASDAFPRARTNPVRGQMLDPTWRAGLHGWHRSASPLRPGCTIPAHRPGRPRPSLSADHDRPQPRRRATRHRALRAQEGRDLRTVECRHSRGREVSKCRRQARRARHADRHVRLLHAPKTALIGGARDRL
jgi:hypothetical protein